MRVDWLLTGGNIRTFDPSTPSATALAIANGRIAAVGSDRELEALFSHHNPKRTDLRGAAVTPGLCDTHMHFEKIAHELEMLQLGDVKSIAEVLQAVRLKADKRKKGAWIRAFGDAWHEENLAERRLPTRRELTEAAPDHPIFLYRRPLVVLNDAAVGALAEHLAGCSPEDWDAESGLLLGPVVRKLNDWLFSLATQDIEYCMDVLKEGGRKLLAMGITTIVDPGLAAAFNQSWDLYRRVIASGGLHQRIFLMNRIDYRRPLAEELARFKASSVLPMEGDDHLRAWALKLFMDGEFADALMRPGQELATPGIRRYSDAELLLIVRTCAERGWPMVVHVMGGGAIRAVIDAVAEAHSRGFGLAPNQVTLAHGFLMDEEDMADCVRLNIGLSVQPLLAYVFVNEMRKAWGPLSDQTNRLRSMWEHGVKFAAGSDTQPCPPLLGASIAVRRRASDGSSIGDREAIDPELALALYTRHAGEYVNDTSIGTLSVGSHADFVVWPHDLLSVDIEKWPALRASLVAIRGREVWSAA